VSELEVFCVKVDANVVEDLEKGDLGEGFLQNKHGKC
jgi:hypothetical protein